MIANPEGEPARSTDPGIGPRVTVLVPCRNEMGYIQPFLAGLRSQEPVPGGVEYLIVDGASDDGTAEFLAEHAGTTEAVRILQNPRKFVSPGLNLGIEKARGSIIVRMDVHTTYADDYLLRCVEVLEETGAQNVGGAARTRATGYWSRAIAAAYGSGFAVGGARFHFEEYEGPVDTVTYGCWRRQTLIELGGFDENLVRNQDDELNLRIVRSGGRIWQSRKIRSWYHPRGSLTKLFRQYFQYGYWKVAVIRKHRLPASWRHLVPATLVASVGLLAVLAVMVPLVRPVLVLELAAYALFLLGGGIHIAHRQGWDLLPALPMTIACFHVAYGSGFLRGLAMPPRAGETQSSSSGLTR